jgi:hypothetical protein
LKYIEFSLVVLIQGCQVADGPFAQTVGRNLLGATENCGLLAEVGIDIQKTNAGIGIPASVISIRYRIKKMSDFIVLFRHQTNLASLVFWFRYLIS